MMTRQEAEKKLQSWTPREQRNYRRMIDAYWRLRQNKGPNVHITRKDVAAEYGSRSIGTASKYMAVFEAIEGVQPQRDTSPAQPPAQPPAAAPSELADTIRTALAAAHDSIDAVAKALIACRTRDEAEPSQRVQALRTGQQFDANAQQCQREETDGRLAAAVARIAELERTQSALRAQATAAAEQNSRLQSENAALRERVVTLEHQFEHLQHFLIRLYFGSAANGTARTIRSP